jgi:hypothetical protein
MVQASLPLSYARVVVPPARPSSSEELEGRELLDSAARMLSFVQIGSPANSVRTPVGKQAYGYRPSRWPTDEAFARPASIRNHATLLQAGWARGITKPDVKRLLPKLAMAYGISPQESRALVALATDWLRNVNSETLVQALER